MNYFCELKFGVEKEIGFGIYDYSSATCPNNLKTNIQDNLN